MSEQHQATVIERMRGTIERIVKHVVKLIFAGERPAVDGILESVAIKEDIKAIFKVSQFNPLRHDLIDRTGKVCMLVVVDVAEYLEGMDAIQPNPGQNSLALEDGGDADGTGAQDPLYIEAVNHVIDTRKVSINGLQRYLKIGYSRAACVVEELEAASVVPAPNSDGEREVILQSPPEPEKDLLSSATEPGATTYGGHTIDDITVMVLRKDEITPGWLQSCFALTTEEAERVALQLLDQGVIVLEQENEESRELNTYRVIKKPGDIALDLEWAMRITKLEITNFQGLRRVALDVSAPVLLVAGRNSASKSSLLDGATMAFNGQPRRVSLKKEIDKLITEGAKEGEAHVEWLDEADEVQACGVALPSGRGSSLTDSPFLPSVLDASRSVALDAKDRRQVLLGLTDASASPAEVGKRLKAKGIDLALSEKVKPLLRPGLSAMVGQAKGYASKAYGAWKAITGENYSSDKVNGQEPEAPPVIVSEEELESTRAELRAAAQDLDEAQQTLSSSKRAHVGAQVRASRITALRKTTALADRRRNKLAIDETNRDEWSEKIMAAEIVVSGEPTHQPMTCSHCQGAVGLQAGQLIAHQPSAEVADPEAARRPEEYRGYLASAQRAVANSQRDLKESEDATTQAAALEAETARAPSAEAIADGEQAIDELRQARDRQQAKAQSLQEALNTTAQRQDAIKQAAGFHAEVCAWSTLADVLSPTGTPAEILADAVGPVNELLQRLSGIAGWSPVQTSADIDVTSGGRLYGLLSESERWRCDATIALAIATTSGLRLALLDRFDVLDVPARTQQAMKLFQSPAVGGEIGTLIVAGVLKGPMAKTPG